MHFFVTVAVLMGLQVVGLATAQELEVQTPSVNHACKLPSLTEMVMLNKCLQQVGLSPEQFTEAYLDDLKNNGYEDQCLTRCFYTELNLIGPDGAASFDAIVNWAKNVVPEARHAGVAPSVQECVATADAQVATYGGIGAAPCKYALFLGLCMNDRLFEPLCQT